MVREEDNGFSEWGGYFEAKKSKLEEQFAAASDPYRKSNLFENISIFVNGLVNPSSDELKRIMMVHGGTFHHYERSHTTFIIASNLPDVKVRKMDTSKIISAQWVVDCLKEMHLVDYKPYLLYTNQKTTQPRLNFKKGNLNDTTAVEVEADAQKQELVGILKELQNAVVSSPVKSSTHVPKVSKIPRMIGARTAVDPAFLGEFYKNSRLHHIATLGAGFKQYICDLRQAHGNKPFPKRVDLRCQLQPTLLSSKRYVMHIDMDCFFVSVGLRNHPELRGLPVAVTHSKGGSAATNVPVHPQADRQLEQKMFADRFEHHLHDNNLVEKVQSGFEKKMSLSEIASCSYEARNKGIKNGMFVGQALKLCPELTTIPYDFDGYRQVAFALYDTVAQYTLNIEAVSCDEMFVDLTDLLADVQVNVLSFVTHLRQEVHDKTGCPCSAGIGYNKLLARMATKLAKPNGQYLLNPDNAADYMASLALDVLPGVGSSITHKLNQAGLKMCGDVQQTSFVRLEAMLGKKMAQTIYENCRGIDQRPLVYEQQRKSISAEVNYGIRFTKLEELEKFLQQLSAEVHKRLIEIKRKTKSITLKLMVRAAEAPVETSKYMGHGVCDNQTKSTLLPQSTDDVTVITHHVLKLMKESGYPPHELRGIGIHLSKLDNAVETKKENDIKSMFVKMSEKQKAITEKPKTADVLKKEPQEVKTKSTNVNVLNMLHSAAANKNSTGFKPIPMEEDPIPSLLNSEAPDYNNMGFKPIEGAIPSVRKKVRRELLKRKPRTPTQSKASKFEVIPEEDTLTIEKPIPTAIQRFDPDVLAHLPEEIQREILSYPEEYLRITESDGQKRYRSNPGLRTPSHSRSISTPSPLTPTPTPPSMRTNSPITQSYGMLSPLSDSDFQPSTSRAALEKRYPRSDDIVADYTEQLCKYMHPAILGYLQLTETLPMMPLRSVPLPAVPMPAVPLPDVPLPPVSLPAVPLPAMPLLNVPLPVGPLPAVLFPEEPLPGLSMPELATEVQPKPVERLNAFANINYKSMLATWVNSEEVPKPADVDLMYMSICYLVDENKMDDVYEVMKYLCRLIKSKRASCCNWHMAYNEIESNIQDKVHDVLDCHIYFTEAIDCPDCA